MMKRLAFGDPVQFGSLRGYIHGTRKEIRIERHPLWQNNHPEWEAAREEAKAQHPGYEVKDMNPFRLLRRPADYV